MMDKKEAKKFTVRKIAEWAFILPAVLTGGYYLFAEELVQDTAREVALDIADSILEEHLGNQKELNTKLEIITNFMKLENEDLYKKAKSLEED